MERTPWRLRRLAPLAFCLPAGCTAALAEAVDEGWRPEQRAIVTREPSALPPAPIPNVPPPITVADPASAREPRNLSLDEAIRLSLENAKAVRVFTGLGASNSGRSIYDAAIANTAIDQQQARFDPALTAEKSYGRSENPQLGFDPLGPQGVGFVGPRIDTYRASIGLTKLNTLGGRTGFSLVKDRNWLNPNTTSLNPFDNKSLELNYTQPLLRGGGFQFNLSPIVLARIDTERSYFQFKDSTQELVRGTIEAYWNHVFARLSLWAAEIQYEQSTAAYEREEARRQAGIINIRDVAQAKVTLNGFKAALVSARADVLSREGALRNVLGLPPSDKSLLVPVSAPASVRFKPGWEQLLQFAGERRPDLIELKLILEGDKQRKIQAENVAMPQLDATALYRWNGQSGRLPPFGERLTTEHGQYTDWSVGINFSVPLGLREGRARVREQDLIILRDRGNLEQGLHAAGHELAVTVRELENTYEQYLAYRETRAAALQNLQVQIEEQRQGRGIYLTVLQALNDWGSAIRSEARALVDYNILLATLERQTGTILETHGLVFIEERFQAAGPMCFPGHGTDRDYPKDLKPSGDPKRYPDNGQPGENTFDLMKPGRPQEKKDGEKAAPKAGAKFAEDK